MFKHGMRVALYRGMENKMTYNESCTNCQCERLAHVIGELGCPDCSCKRYVYPKAESVKEELR